MKKIHVVSLLISVIISSSLLCSDYSSVEDLSSRNISKNQLNFSNSENDNDQFFSYKIGIKTSDQPQQIFSAINFINYQWHQCMRPTVTSYIGLRTRDNQQEIQQALQRSFCKRLFDKTFIESNAVKYYRSMQHKLFSQIKEYKFEDTEQLKNNSKEFKLLVSHPKAQSFNFHTLIESWNSWQKTYRPLTLSDFVSKASKSVKELMKAIDNRHSAKSQPIQNLCNSA